MHSNGPLSAALDNASVPREHAPPQADTCVEEVVGLFASLRKPLQRYALTFGIMAGDVEEIVQETFLALFKHLRSGKSRENLPGWAFRVCHNLAIKHTQKSREERNWISFEAARSEQSTDGAADPEQQMLQAQRRARLQAVLRALPVQDRCCVSLRAEGLRYREIAETLGMSLGAVSISLTRSLAKFERADQE